MRIIFARHDGDVREYVFEIGKDQDISKGDLLLVDTKYGRKIAIATTGVIEGSGAKEVAMKQGAYFPLRKVITYANWEMVHNIREAARTELISKITRPFDEEYYEELPYCQSRHCRKEKKMDGTNISEQVRRYWEEKILEKCQGCRCFRVDSEACKAANEYAKSRPISCSQAAVEIKFKAIRGERL